MKLTYGDKTLDLDAPRVMGILNVTPDSFSDGGKYSTTDQAVKYFEEMVDQGADIIDIGGESTGPGSQDVTLEEELNRVIPVLKAVRKRSDVWISVDTYKAEVARQAVEEGADMINDVLALRGDAKMIDVLAATKVPIVIMYSKDTSGRTTGDSKDYDDVIEYVKNFLEERIKTAEIDNIERGRFIVDPGQGAFISADPKYSLQILKRLGELKSMGLPILIGSSRKSIVGRTLNLPPHERMEGSLACACIAVMNGASIIRAHDVKETKRVVDMTWAIMQS